MAIAELESTRGAIRTGNRRVVRLATTRPEIRFINDMVLFERGGGKIKISQRFLLNQ